VVEEAGRRAAAMDDAAAQALADAVTMGLPGSTEAMDARRACGSILPNMARSAPDRLRRHFIDFLTEVVPVAEEVGVRLCCHPDDPPFPLLGLPRIMSTEADYDAILDAVDSPATA
jgi:mannonate dehydratase